MVMVMNNRSFFDDENENSKVVLKMLFEKLTKFQQAFFTSDKDASKIDEMAKDQNAKNYVHIIIFQSMWRHNTINDPEDIFIQPIHMKLISTCSFHFCEEGANIDWIMTNPFQLESFEK